MPISDSAPYRVLKPFFVTYRQLITLSYSQSEPWKLYPSTASQPLNTEPAAQVHGSSGTKSYRVANQVDIVENNGKLLP